jgi:hypothetical protein
MFTYACKVIDVGEVPMIERLPILGDSVPILGVPSSPLPWPIAERVTLAFVQLKARPGSRTRWSRTFDRYDSLCGNLSHNELADWSIYTHAHSRLDVEQD